MINQNIKCLIIRSSELDSPSGEVFNKFKRDLKRTFKNESYLEDSYEYNKDELINNFEKDYCGIYKNDILEYLKNNLDENLKYI